MNKCPKCGAIGNRIKVEAHMYQCPKEECLTYFDSKGQIYNREIRGGFIKVTEGVVARGDGDMGKKDLSQRDRIKQVYNRETLLEAIAKTSGIAIAKQLNVNSGQITLVCREYEIDQKDIDRKRAELAKESIDADLKVEQKPEPVVEKVPEVTTPEPEPELTPEAELEMLELGTELGLDLQVTTITNPTPAEVEQFYEDTNPVENKSEAEAEEYPEETTERYYIIEGQEKCSKDYPLEVALEKIRTEYSVKQCENVHLVKETRILKEVPFTVAMSVAVNE